LSPAPFFVFKLFVGSIWEISRLLNPQILEEPLALIFSVAFCLFSIETFLNEVVSPQEEFGPRSPLKGSWLQQQVYLLSLVCDLLLIES
jgi:hypothetical protein